MTIPLPYSSLCSPLVHCLSSLLSLVSFPVKELVWEVWDPSHPYHIRWDFLMLLLMVYVVVVTPYFIAFEINTVSKSSCREVSYVCKQLGSSPP